MKLKFKTFICNLCIPILRIGYFLSYVAQLAFLRTKGKRSTLTASEVWSAAKASATFTMWPEEESAVCAGMDRYMAAINKIDTAAVSVYKGITKALKSPEFLRDAQLNVSVLSDEFRLVIVMSILSVMADRLFEIVRAREFPTVNEELTIRDLHYKLTSLACTESIPRYCTPTRAEAVASQILNLVSTHDLQEEILKNPELLQRLIVQCRQYCNPDEMWEIINQDVYALDFGDTIPYVYLKEHVWTSTTNDDCVVKLVRDDDVKMMVCKLVTRNDVRYATISGYYSG